MARSAVLPASITDPSGLDGLERRALKEMHRKFMQCLVFYKELVNGIQFETIETNAKRYVFQTLPATLSNMMDVTNSAIDRIMLEGGQSNVWLFDAYVQQAVRNGTGKAHANLSAQVTEYALARPSLESVLFSPPYQKRLGFVAAREFQQMQGISGDVKKELAQTLTDGLARGLGPLEISKNLQTRIAVPEARANTIARTEINQAFKQARREEAEEAATAFSFSFRMLHLSAMSPTTRKTHAARNGSLHTVLEQQLWYSEDGNAINCKCSEIEIVVDQDGKPLSDSAVRKANERKLVYAGSGG